MGQQAPAGPENLRFRRESAIPTRQYTVRVRGSRRKDVTCANCGCPFAYTMSCVASGYALDTVFDGPEDPNVRAEREARTNLDAQLARGCDLVPCPDCGRYQPDMVRKIRWRRVGWLVALNVLAGAGIVWWLKTQTTGWGDQRERQQALLCGVLAALDVLALVLWVVLPNPNSKSKSARRAARAGGPGARAVRRPDPESQPPPPSSPPPPGSAK